MARLMSDIRFHDEQWQHRYDKHIPPINGFVDELCRDSGRGWVPYIAPMYGGINARLLSVLRDPGPMTQINGGSGFICMENDDATAETISKLFAEVAIDAGDILPWNAYPWYINRAPNVTELQAGVEPLKRIIELLPALRVVMLHGGSAQNGWKRLTRRYPNLVTVQKLHIIETFHTSRQAFWHADPKVRTARRAHLHKAFREASNHLRA